MTAATQPEWQADPVIATIRAELARKGISKSALPGILGNSQAYWGRRMIGETAFDVHDLRLLADLVGVPVAAFFADDAKAPRPEPRGSLRARRDSNPQPSEGESNVTFVDFVERGVTRLLEQHDLAPVLAFPGVHHAAV